MNVQYNIYFGLTTQNGLQVTNQDKGAAIDLIASQFACFTVLESFGYWQGQRENCVKIEIIQELIEDEKFLVLSLELARILDQEAVLYTRYDLFSQLAEPKPKPELATV